MSNLIPFPNSKEKIYLTQDELTKYNDLLDKLKSSITPVEAKFYKKEIETIIENARLRNKG